jgi:hypothetical protein
MKLFLKALLGCAVLGVIVSASGSAYADGITLVSPQISKLVPPIAALNFEHHGARKTETGGVSYDGTQDVWFGDISAGPHQRTVSLTELGIGQAADLRVLLNINEANGGSKMPLTVDSLVLTAYDQNGKSVFSASLVNGPMDLNQFKQGQGSQSDWVFGLDSVAAARLQAALDQDPALRLGLTSTLSNVDGGPERFYFAGAATPTPEPATLVLLGTGIAGLAGAARKRKAAAKKAAAEAEPS